MGGQCYVNAYKLLFSGEDYTLVHGVVSGQGELKGVRFDHAWVEINGAVIDNGIVHYAKDYYELGEIVDPYKYSLEQVQALQPKDYGPWEPELIELNRSLECRN